MSREPQSCWQQSTNPLCEAADVANSRVTLEEKLQLSGKQRRHLRALGHHIEPVVLFGKHGLNEAVIAAVDEAVLSHELIKVRRGGECPDSRNEIAEALTAELGVEVVQQLGHTMLLYRRHPEEPFIELP